MKFSALITLILLIFFLCKTNSQVCIKIMSLPENTQPNARIYLAGNFNEWNPGNETYELIKENDGIYKLCFNADLSELEYKFTLGSWELEECSKEGNTIQNRKSNIYKSDTIFVQIEGWKTGIKKHTTSGNVFILKEDFYMPQLDRKRRIWIYLPTDYNTSKRSYPVFYAHDGQNLFDVATSFSGEWGIDECLDSLYEINGKSSIVVGIDNSGEFRIEELTPWPNEKYGGGNGKLYADFIVSNLKPYIDSAFRTLPDRKNTGVFGSSLGGLESFYMALTYPEIFGKAGIFSPSFWFSSLVNGLPEKFEPENKLKMYIIAGDKEDEFTESEIKKMKGFLDDAKFNKTRLKVEIITGGQHNEWFWRREFPTVYEWLMK